MTEVKENEKSRNKSSAHLIGGFVGGLTAAVALQPLDLLKTRIQQQPKGVASATAAGSSNNGVGSMFIKLMKENPLQLWRGTLPSALRTSIGSGLYLSCLNSMRTQVAILHSRRTGEAIQTSRSSKLPELSMSANLVTGAIARGVVGYITMPITIIKVRYESTFYDYHSLKDAVRDIYRTDKINGFFKGFGATCLRDAPYAGLYVLLYEKAKDFTPFILPSKLISFEDTHNNKYSTATSTLINTTSAFVAAGIATTITAPFDTLKTRMQLEPSKFNNFVMTFNHMLKNESILSLFSGLSMRLTRKAFSAGIAWSIYEELIKRFM
ncbi:similar to Saccharomyces cerevisiae YDL119C Putative mitochondrial transport protein [Maudiozyma saulgeensis]|uniref:Mitochondrial glycine transporter n=1 Tax=Maudiozyma saulgeensis TaxID=1789683 RepID=A0A1X7QZY0_9SACH|nr:similar to Saccharomyces cerevisiae YDL119C Putative mitochondrial transport protein [Kazachstania saulgeensis]